MDKYDRFKEVISAIKFHYHIRTQKDVAKQLGYSSATNFSEMLNGKIAISDNVIESLRTKFGINPNYIKEGSGKIFEKDSLNGDEIPNCNLQSESASNVIKYWREIEATGGGLESFNDIKSDYVPLTLPDFQDCTDAVNIVGESMEPTYKSGSIIVLKEWKESFIDFGHAYLIITKNGNRMVKILRKVEENLSQVRCESINPSYDSFEIPKSDILRLYIVKGVISKNAM